MAKETNLCDSSKLVSHPQHIKLGFVAFLPVEPEGWAHTKTLHRNAGAKSVAALDDNIRVLLVVKPREMVSNNAKKGIEGKRDYLKSVRKPCTTHILKGEGSRR